MKYDKLIQEINRKRILQGLSIVELSKIGGCSCSIIGDWFIGRRKPSRATTISAIYKIAEHLKIDANELKYGLIDLPVVEEKPESVIFTAKPKAQTGNFIKLDNGMIADISTGKTFTLEQFNQLFEVA